MDHWYYPRKNILCDTHKKAFVVEKMAKRTFTQRMSCVEALEQVDQRACGFLIPGSLQGHIQFGFEQCGLVKISTLCHGGFEMDDDEGSFQLKTIL